MCATCKIVDETKRMSDTNTNGCHLNETHTRETAIKQWSATFEVSRPRAQGGDTAGRDVRATDLLACDTCATSPLGASCTQRTGADTGSI